jgi:hypothetical protein
MPYSISSSRASFDADIAVQLSTVQTATKKAFPSQDTRNALFCAAMIRSAVAAEIYTESFLTHYCAHVVAAGITSEKLPLTLRTHLIAQDDVVDVFGRFVILRDEVQLHDRLGKLVHEPFLGLAAANQPLPAIGADTVYKKQRFPSEKNLKAVFRRIGIQDLFQKLSRSMSSNASFELDAFLGLRNAFAHEQNPPGVTRTDVSSAIRKLQRFIAHLDRVLWSHWGQQWGYTTWPQ